ncbi:MAG: hypothetical protein PUB73_06265 [Bacteroidales bacterium]|nr:hypothetical protein [Bacteroidales bacterium]
MMRIFNAPMFWTLLQGGKRSLPVDKLVRFLTSLELQRPALKY